MQKSRGIPTVIVVALGAITALLIAPKTGRQMRKTLRRKYEDARDAMDDIQDQASDWIDNAPREPTAASTESWVARNPVFRSASS